MSIALSWGIIADSDIGDRQEQQDRYLIKQSNDGKHHLLVVADGAGGHRAGALAAQTAIDCVEENHSRLCNSEDPEKSIGELIIECNERVLALEGEELACATLVILLIRGEELFWGHVGDSRLYLIRKQEAIYQTTDHSLSELERQTPQASSQSASGASSASASNEIFMCLGALPNIVPELSSSMARQGDTLLLCSDGLCGQLDMQPLLKEIGDNALTPELLTQYIDQAKTSKPNNSDNITLVLARLSGTPRFWSRPLSAITGFFKNKTF